MNQKSDKSDKCDTLNVFDELDFLRRVLEDRGLASTLLACFLGDIPLQQSILKKAFYERDLEAVAYRAHALQGAAASVSAMAVRQAAEAIELLVLGHAGIDEIASAVRRLDSEMDHLRIELERKGWLSVVEPSDDGGAR